MSIQKLSVGAMVRFARLETRASGGEREYRIEQLVEIGEGSTLYRIQSASEPFSRVVSEAELVTRY